MQRKRQVRKAGIVLLIVGAGALGIIMGVVLFMTNPDLIPRSTPPTDTPAPIEVVATNTPTPYWVVTYEYRFSPDLLAAGRHEYEIGVSCPAGIGTGTYRGVFTISSQAELQRSRVYIRPTGVWDAAFRGNQLSAVHPDQAVGAALSLRYDTLDQSEEARANCKVSVQLDQNQPVRMDPALPKEVEP